MQNVTTASLSAYNDATNSAPRQKATSRNWNATTLYVCFIPSSQVKTLQADIQNGSSPLYTNQVSRVSQELVGHIDRTFNILTEAGPHNSSSTDPRDDGDGSDKHTVRDVLIGVCSAAGALILVLLGVLGWCWKTRREERAAGGAKRQHSSHPHMSHHAPKGAGEQGRTITVLAGHGRERSNTITSISPREIALEDPNVEPGASTLHRLPTARSCGLRERWEVDPAEQDDLFGLSSSSNGVVGSTLTDTGGRAGSTTTTGRNPRETVHHAAHFTSSTLSLPQPTSSSGGATFLPHIMERIERRSSHADRRGHGRARSSTPGPDLLGTTATATTTTTASDPGITATAGQGTSRRVDTPFSSSAAYSEVPSTSTGGGGGRRGPSTDQRRSKALWSEGYYTASCPCSTEELADQLVGTSLRTSPSMDWTRSSGREGIPSSGVVAWGADGLLSKGGSGGSDTADAGQGTAGLTAAAMLSQQQQQQQPQRGGTNALTPSQELQLRYKSSLQLDHRPDDHTTNHRTTMEEPTFSSTVPSPAISRWPDSQLNARAHANGHISVLGMAQ